MKVLYRLLLVVALLSSANPAVVVDALEYPNEIFTGNAKYRIIKIVDGDTIRIEYLGVNERVRLIGVDTPEPDEEFGEAAAAFTRNLLKGESVYLRFDTLKRDMYGRLLAYVYRASDGLSINLEIIQQGQGETYDKFPFKYKDQFQDAETQARILGLGMWKPTPERRFTMPTEHEQRKKQGLHQINQISLCLTAILTKVLMSENPAHFDHLMTEMERMDRRLRQVFAKYLSETN